MPSLDSLARSTVKITPLWGIYARKTEGSLSPQPCPSRRSLGLRRVRWLFGNFVLVMRRSSVPFSPFNSIVGSFFRRRVRPLEDDSRLDLGGIVARESSLFFGEGSKLENCSGGWFTWYHITNWDKGEFWGLARFWWFLWLFYMILVSFCPRGPFQVFKILSLF